jgi:hypothetical protein
MLEEAAILSDPDPSSTPAHDVAKVYRKLRKSRKDAKDESGAADFYYGEIEMRRAAAPQWSSEWLSWLYLANGRLQPARQPSRDLPAAPGSCLRGPDGHVRVCRSALVEYLPGVRRPTLP